MQSVVAKRTEPVWALVPAGGHGVRMGAALPKQYLPLGGKTIIEHTLLRLAACPSVDHIIVGVAKGDERWVKLNFVHDKLHSVTTAGAQRADTVRNLLEAMPSDAKAHWALVHDAVRPCVRITDIEKLIADVAAQTAGGLLAIPMHDTAKQADNAQCVTHTIPRAGLWRALTPQLFKAQQLAQALDAAIDQGDEITDEASAIEAQGGAPLLVEGAADNIKITRQDDLTLAGLILQAQQEAVA